MKGGTYSINLIAFVYSYLSNNILYRFFNVVNLNLLKQCQIKTNLNISKK